MGPLVYLNNREVIDAHIDNAQEVINSQASQLKGIAEEQTAHATGLVKQYVDDYSAKAQGYIVPRRSVSPEVTKVAPSPSPVVKQEPVAEPAFKASDFPEAPKEEPLVDTSTEQVTTQEPLLAA